MKKNLKRLMLCMSLLPLMRTESMAQITMLQDYKNYNSPAIGTFQGINFREAGFSTLYPIPGTNGKEFWTCSDRGVNVDCSAANPSGCTPTYDKMFCFPSYAPKIHRIRINGDSIQILRTITMKRPGGTNASGVLNPAGFGSTATELASTDTVLNCAGFNSKVAAKDTWAIDPEALVVDKDGYFYVGEENGPTIWKMNPNGVAVKRYSPYANLSGAQPQDVQIDTAYKYRKNNRGFESMAIAPNGKIYTIIQSPLLYPNTATGENTRIHRILEIDPATNAQRMLVYLNDGIIGTGANQIRLRDWKIGDMAAINDTTFLVIEAALRGTTDIKRIYKINISGATAVNSGLYGGQTLEALTDSAGLAFQGIVPVKKTLMMDANANGWPSSLEKIEGLAIINDSTIAVCNDNDFGQVSPAANGIATATGYLSHLFTYRLQGSNKLSNYNFLNTTYTQGRTAQSSSQPPYITPTIPGATYTSIISTGDVVNGYKMVGIPDGLGAYDNNDGTFTLLMNHELGNTSGIARAHGSMGAFVSKWVINKSDLTVVSGSDLMQNVKLWNPATSSYITYNTSFPSASAAFARFCSADLAAPSAYYNTATGKGTQERIFMDGEENGNEGRAMGHIATGPNAGTSYELPYLGKFSWENSVANPRSSDLTIVGGMDDATPGQVYFYVGSKSNNGNEIEKAGLSGGKLYSVAVNGLLTETSANVPTANTSFSVVDLGNVQNMTGTTLNTNSNNAGVTTFLRPEDGAWDPSNPNDFYFNTTNAFNSPSRLWKLHFNNLDSIMAGGTITAVLDGTEGQQMLDNMTIDNSGHILLVEDVGNNAHLGKIWQYTIATDSLVQIGVHDSTRFLSNGANYLTQDEEASGILDVQNILGAGMFLTVVQAHYAIPGELVEGGQLLAFNNPATAAANPEIDLQGNAISIADGDVTPSTSDNTDFGNVTAGTAQTKTFMIRNSGPGSLKVNGITFAGTNASDFILTGAPAFPLTLAANASQTITVQFTPAADGTRNATMNIMNNDFNENIYDVALKGGGVSPEINVQGNNVNIIDGDLTAGTANNTDFGNVTINNSQTRSFVIQNTGAGTLKVTGITFTGTNATEFTLPGSPTFPMDIAANGSQTVDVKFTPVATGIRTATINIANTDSSEAIYDFVLQGISTSPTGISNTTAAEGNVKLYPNPTGNEAAIDITLKKEERLIISVYDMQGKQVLPSVDRTFSSGNQHLVLNTASIQNGIYFVQIASGSETTRIKMVVVH
ncbi:choice-of-anchor D domain-containing protein [Chitinophagaceae bacterium MMS25-I14]